MRNPKDSLSGAGADMPINGSGIDILIVYPKVLTGLLIAEALSHNPNFHVAAHVSSADAVIAYAANAPIDVVLIGTNLTRHGDGLDVLRQIRSQCNGMRSVILAENPEPAIVVEAFRFGARGVFSMANNGYQLLCKCVQCVKDGEVWINSRELHWVMNSLCDTPVGIAHSASIRVSNVLEFKKLSRREEDVVKLLADGLSNRDIARSLNLSENTISNYLSQIFNKVGVSNRTELLSHTLRVPRDFSQDRRNTDGSTTRTTLPATLMAEFPMPHARE
jgi:DNA-binding NarL/FixJ family response regulator